MSLQVGPYLLKGTDAQNASISKIAQTMADKLALPEGGYRVRPTEVLFLPGYVKNKPGTMPTYDGTHSARGFYRGRKPRILMHDAIDKYPVAKSFAHETMHGLDDDWLSRRQKVEIREMMEPELSGWPSEIFAVYASAAIAGFDKVNDGDIYNQASIPKAKWPQLAAISLRDDRTKPIPPPVPEPVDPCAAVKAELETVKGLLAIARGKGAEIAAL